MEPILIRREHRLVNFTEGKEIYIIYFALATTGFCGEICQIAAMGEDDESPWSVNILPDEDFNPRASAYNGYTSRVGTDELRHLYKDGIKAEVYTLSKGLVDFLRYVVGKANNSTRTTVLVGWCSQNFHIPLFLKALKRDRLSLKPLEDSGICYADPYLLIKQTREQFPQLSGVSSLSLPVIYQTLYPSNILNSFDASHIVQMLKSVVSSLEVTKESIKGYSFTLSSAEMVRKYRWKVKKNLTSMKGKLYQPQRSTSEGTRGAITESMAKKIAESGLKYQDLKKVYRRCGREGLERLLKTPLPLKEGERQAKPRVTRCQRIIEAIVTYFEQRKVHCS
jgi:hypothetical protein